MAGKMTTLSSADRLRRRKHIFEITTQETRIKGGIAAASLNMKNCTALFGLSQEARVANATKGGKVGGRIAVESGHLDSVRTKESCAKGGRAACHVRHHVNKHKFNPNCEFCCEAATAAQE